VLDNLDLGCSLIRKAVMEKALEDVTQDPIIMKALEKRQLAQKRGETYVDESYQRIVSFLPEALRPRLGGLLPQELRIYEDFNTQ
jgi:CCR4-NOT transcription complex subunit 1